MNTFLASGLSFFLGVIIGHIMYRYKKGDLK